MTRILVVDDEPQILRALRINLTARGYEVITAADGAGALRAAAQRHPDVIVLDLGLPDLDGIEVLAGLKGWCTAPVIVLSARTDSADKVAALDTGADDYVTKPFSPRELLARIRANVRRVRGQAGPAQETIVVGGLVLDPAKMTVTLDGAPIEVTAYEFAILRALAQRPGKVLSREQLLDLAKGSADLSFDRSIDVHVSRLRAKLGDDSRSPKILKTVRGVGYLLAGGDS